MKKTLSIALGVALVLGAMAAAPAQAGKKKKAKPVAMTYFMHGQAPFGEVDGAQWLADGSSPQSPLTLDATEPEGSNAKSMAIGSPVWNSACTGLPLGFPTFSGELAGTIVGDATLKVSFQGAPQSGVARIWADVGAFQACNDEYIEPAAEVPFDAGSGELEIKFEGLKLAATGSIMIELLVPERAAPTTRLQYDATGAPSSFTFNCIPASGSSCAP